MADELRGVRVLHLNATPYGGGVSELLRSGVPLLNDLGLVGDWKIISGDDPFFQVAKTVHNGLQGAAHGLTAEDRAVFRVRRACAAQGVSVGGTGLVRSGSEKHGRLDQRSATGGA